MGHPVIAVLLNMRKKKEKTTTYKSYIYGKSYQHFISNILKQMTGWFMWSITFSISLAPLARNHLGNRSGRNSFFKLYSCIFIIFIVASEVVTIITFCEIKINALLRRWKIIFGDMEIYIISRSARSLLYNDECIWYGMLKARCYRLAPLLFGGKFILVIFAQNICIRNCFFGLQMPHFPCPGRAPPPRPSQLSSQSTFGDMEIIGNFQRRSLASLTH